MYSVLDMYSDGARNLFLRGLYIYIYICVCVCVCVYVYMYVCMDSKNKDPNLFRLVVPCPLNQAQTIECLKRVRN